MSIYFGIILCTRIPLCQSSMKQWIVLRLNLKLSLPCSSNYALHLGWNGGGGTQYKSVYRGVPQTWVAKSRWSGLSVGPFFCKIWCQKSQNLCQKSINFHKNCRHENFQEKAGIPAFWSEFMQFSFLLTRFWAFWQDFLFFVKSHSHAWNCDFCIIWVKFGRLVYGLVPSSWVVSTFHAVHLCADQTWVAKPTHAIKLLL